MYTKKEPVNANCKAILSRAQINSWFSYFPSVVTAGSTWSWQAVYSLEEGGDYHSRKLSQSFRNLIFHSSLELAHYTHRKARYPGYQNTSSNVVL